MPLPASFAELQENEAVMLYLPRLEWRAEHSLTRLREVGFRNVALEAGVDSALEDARAAALVDGWRFDPGITPGEIGFSTSMLRIWQRVVDEDLAYLLVFEDDVLPHPDIDRVGQTYWDETPSDADFVFLGSRMDRTDLARLPGRVVALPTWCTHAYVVTQRGAAEGLERLRDQITRADRWPRVLDQELRRWMEDGLVRYACWNGSLLPPAFPRSDQVLGGGVLPTDVAWVDRDTGPFFQNFSLVSRDPAPPKGRAVLITPVAPTLRGDAFADRALVVL
ncbi:MAG: glycosyl transferase, family 25, partial [Acidimicrobiaceae bacterium]